MTWFQALVLRFLPHAKAESQDWMLRCPCGGEVSFWDIGGIRYKAKGNPRKLWRCKNCGNLTWHSVYRKSEGKP